MLPGFKLAILTAMRLGEQFGLKWQWVNFSQGFIPLPHTKAGGVQYVHLNAEAQAILRSLQIQQMNQRTCGSWVIPSKNPATHIDKNNLCSRIFIPAVKAAKLEDVTWHTLRHTFASRLGMAKYSEVTIAALLRHASTYLVKRYTHLSQDYLKEALEDVSEFGQQPRKPETQDPTVTKTGNPEKSVLGRETELIELIGAGEGI